MVGVGSGVGVGIAVGEAVGYAVGVGYGIGVLVGNGVNDAEVGATMTSLATVFLLSPDLFCSRICDVLVVVGIGLV